MPSTKVLEAKKDIVNEIKEKIQNAKSVVLFDYNGLTDEASKKLRINLKNEDSDYKVYKNTLLKIAFKDLNFNLDEYLEGPTGIAFSSDDVAAVKILSDTAKKNETMSLKAGIIEGNIVGEDKLKEFASIPSRDGLYTMLAGSMLAIIKDLSIALNLYTEQKEN